MYMYVVYVFISIYIKYTRYVYIKVYILIFYNIVLKKGADTFGQKNISDQTRLKPQIFFCFHFLSPFPDTFAPKFIWPF